MAAGGYGGAGGTGTQGAGGTYGTAATAGTGNSGGGGGASGSYAGYAGGYYAAGVQGGTGGRGGGNGTPNGIGTNNAAVTGGTGGTGTAGTGTAMNRGSGGGGGGAGGYGLVVTATTVAASNNHFTNTGNVTGGTGGTGGQGAAVSGSGMTGGTGGQGGGGGAGARVNDANATFYNSAAIQGGKGGLGGAGGAGSNGATNGQAGQSGAGGDGVDLAAGTLINRAGGTITGGQAGRPAQAAHAGYGVRGGSGTGPTGTGGAATTVINYGRISGAVGVYGIGVDLKGAGSSLVNRGSGSIVSASLSPNATVPSRSIAAVVNGSLQNLDNATITGGTGATVSGAGAVGGYAALVQNGSLTNTSTISGGAGGYGASMYGGRGGLGANLYLSTGTNSGTIAGGAGGGSYSGTGGNGAVGTTLIGSYLKNTGTITGGAGGASQIGTTSGAGGSGATLYRSSVRSPDRTFSTLYNSGTIQGGQGSGGSAGGVGTYAESGTIINNGLIAGGTTGGASPVQADSVNAGFLNVNLAIGSNGSFQGAVDIFGSATVTFNQALQSSFSADATLSTNIIGGGRIIKVGAGILTLSSGASTFSGGSTINAGTLDLAAAATIVNGATVAGAAGTGAITFAGASGSLAILSLETAAQPASGGTFSNTLNNFDDYDQLDIKGFAFDGRGIQAIPLARNGNTGTLTVMNRTGSESFTLTGTLAQQYYIQSDGNGGTLITDGTVCYCAGTRIRTVRGGVATDTAVEDLRIGDLVVTSSGAHRPIKWLGHRAVDCRRHPRPHEVMPIRIAAHAFGPDRPARDLRVSPGHSMCLDVLGEVLIPASSLVNGSTVRQEQVDAVTYWHVELDSHDILLAEGLPAESYLDMGNRDFFAENGVVSLSASPDAAVRTHVDFCRPFHADGTLVEAVRARLAVRAGAIEAARPWPKIAAA